MRRLHLLIGVCLAGSCAPPVRFADREILWREPDEAPIPVPRERDPQGTWLGLRDAVFLPADRELALDYGRESANVNALDEVPDSSWFRDPRRSVDPSGAVRLRALGAAAIARGAGDDVAPVPPYTVVKAKPDGANLGFIVEDSRKIKYAFKIDPPGLVGLDTATEVVVARLAWAAGWLVPDEALIDFRPDELRLAEKAKSKDHFGRSTPFKKEKYEDLLRSLPVGPDGTIRAVASRWIPGKLVGPFTYFGRRRDDANDRVEHQDRRDLRGFGVFCAWVNNIDTLENNTLDAYVGEPGRGHLLHYQQDVGGSFGGRAVGPMQYWMGEDVYLAPSRILASLVTLGAWPRPHWEGERARVERARLDARWPELGYFDAEHFDARHWKPVLDNPAFDRMTPRDRYWGAKRLLAFTPEELRAAIALGRYRPAAAERLYEILWKRRERLMRVAFGDVAALDHFGVSDGKLCFDDLWLDAGLGGAASYTADGAPIAGRCVALGPPQKYRVVELRVRRSGERRFGPAVRVHLSGFRIVGLER